MTIPKSPRNRKYLMLGLGLLLMGLVIGVGIGLGRLLDHDTQKPLIAVTIDGQGQTPRSSSGQGTQQAFAIGGRWYSASINGSRYYPPGCRGAERIKKNNRVWFISSDEAESAGYSRAIGC